jgi:RNA polymerase sigma-70 factor, ECF subfamily
VKTFRGTLPKTRFDKEFQAFVAQRAVAGKPPPFLDDLNLAFRCLQGEPTALVQFERAYLPKIRRSLRRIAGRAGYVEEAEQRMRVKLFTRTDGAVPRIEQYAGQGPLLHWVRAVAVRELLDLRRKEHGPDVDESEAEGLAAAGSDPELHLIQGEYKDQFRQAFRQALSRLTPAQRTVLRMYAVEGLTLERIGRLYGVHRSTILRRFEGARARLLEEIREELKVRLSLKSTQLSSWMRLAKSQLEISMGPLLAEGE